MNRITFTLDENGHLVRICADEEVEVFIVQPSCERDKVYQWSSLKVGAVDDEINGEPIYDRWTMPPCH